VQENHDMGIACMHGEDECAGNRMQLCARELYPDLNDWFNFVVCQAGSFTSVPRNGEECARKVGLDYEKLIKCSAQDALGQDLLRASLALSKERGVVYGIQLNSYNYLINTTVQQVVFGCHKQQARVHPRSLVVVQLSQRLRGGRFCPPDL